MTQIGFVVGDMKNPVRDLPRVINTAMTTVILSFVLVNISLYLVIPIEVMRDNDTPGVVSCEPLSSSTRLLVHAACVRPHTNSL